jgi:hypothetical protein
MERKPIAGEKMGKEEKGRDVDEGRIRIPL